jgi:hypothetical protein
MPPVENLPEGVSAAQFKSDYGKKDGPKVLAELKKIDSRINALPPYKRLTNDLLIPP